MSFVHVADLNDRLYSLDSNGKRISEPMLPVSQPLTGAGFDPIYRGNGAVVRDATGELHQRHAGQGLLRPSDGIAIIPPGQLESVTLSPDSRFGGRTERHDVARWAGPSRRGV